MKNLNLIVINFYETLIKTLILLFITALVSYALSLPAKTVDKGLTESTVTTQQLKNW